MKLVPSNSDPRQELLESLVRLRESPGQALEDKRTRELMSRASEAAMSMPDDAFLARLLETEYAALGRSGDILVCSVLSNVAEERQLQGAVPTLNRMLADPRTLALHEDLAETLGEIGDESSVPFLIGALSSKENWVRAKSAESLGKLSDTRAIAPLILLLKDDSESVIENAIDALADMRAIEGSGALTQVAASPEESTFLRSKAIQALAQMRSKEALPFLQRLVDSQENNEVVTAARQAIAALDSSA